MIRASENSFFIVCKKCKNIKIIIYDVINPKGNKFIIHFKCKNDRFKSIRSRFLHFLDPSNSIRDAY